MEREERTQEATTWKASYSIRRIEFEEMGRTALTRIDKVQITKTSTTLNEETSPVNPHDSAPFSLIRALRPLRAHEDSIYML